MRGHHYIFSIFIAFLWPVASNAQSDSIPQEKTLLNRLDALEKKSDKFNLFFNMQGDFSVLSEDGDYVGGKFNMRQFRIEAKGNINDWLSYRYRQRFTGLNGQVTGFDNIMLSIDNAYLGVRLGRWQMIFGKQCAAYGGFEFDSNPIDIYEASDINGAGISYVTGAQIGYNFTDDQQLNLQIVNSNPISSQEMYGHWAPALTPLMYTLNWNADFSGVFKTRWSASLMEQVKGKRLYFYALGNELCLGRFGAYFDWMYSRDGVDLRGIITDIVGGTDPVRSAQSAEYMSYLLHLNYRFLPKWNIFGKLMIESEGVYASHDAERDGMRVYVDKGRYRTAYGYIGGVEYYPLPDASLHFFAVYVGRSYRYTSMAKAIGSADYSTNRFSVGFVWRMPVF